MSKHALTHPKLLEKHRENIRTWKWHIKNEREKLAKLEASFLLIEPVFPDCFFGEKIYCRIDGGTKADFSSAVERVAAIIGESPDISVNPGEYCADFVEHKVQVFLKGPNDCKLIEVEEVVTKTVKKPHPECLAALRVLEDIA
jgi:hypothetical protein